MHTPQLPNRAYRYKLMENPLADTPLFDSASTDAGVRPITPPRTTRASETQRAAFEALRPKITERQQQVLAALTQRGPSTTIQLAEFMKWTINLVSGRIAELQRQGYVTIGGTVTNADSGRQNSIWKVL